MDLNLRRTVFTKESTIGPLTIAEDFECFILEPSWKENRPNFSCIPPGRYRITLYLSPSRGDVVPLLHGVPGRTAIEIHIGNWAKDTHGCLLTGRVAGADYVAQSALAFNLLVTKIMSAIDQAEEVWIDIK
jgi:hypothetical protein